MTTWQRVVGDKDDTIVVGLNGIDDITGATIVGHVWQGTAAATNLTGTILNATADGTDAPCSVTIALGGSSGWLATATAGAYRFDVKLTFTDTSTKTWPSGNPDTIVVRSHA